MRALTGHTASRLQRLRAIFASMARKQGKYRLKRWSRQAKRMAPWNIMKVGDRYAEQGQKAVIVHNRSKQEMDDVFTKLYNAGWRTKITPVRPIKGERRIYYDAWRKDPPQKISVTLRGTPHSHETRYAKAINKHITATRRVYTAGTAGTLIGSSALAHKLRDKKKQRLLRKRR